MRFLGFGGFIGVMLCALATCAAATLLLPIDPYIRFQNLEGTIYHRATWIYDRVHHDDTPIDVVFIGSSRTGAGVYPTLLEPALAARGVSARVVNFSLPSSGFDIRATIMEEMLSEKKPRLLVFSVVEAFPRDGHDAFGDIASVSDILTAPWLVNRNLPHNLFRLPVRQILLFLATLTPEAFGLHGVFDPEGYAGSTVDSRDMLDFQDDLAAQDTPEHAEKLAAQAAARRHGIRPPVLPDSLSWIEFGVSRSYVERIMAMAEAHNIEVAFLFIPFFTGPDAPLEETWLKRFGPLWKANFIKGDPSNYENAGHTAASPRVKVELTEWMADRVSAMLADRSGSS